MSPLGGGYCAGGHAHPVSHVLFDIAYTFSRPFIESSSAQDLLNVQFSGVTLGNPEYASVWLKERLLGKRVWFTLLDHTSQAAVDQKAIQCIVHIRRKV